MKRLVKYVNHHFAPHQETGARAIALRHEALLLYSVFLFLFQFGLYFVSTRFPGILGFASNISIEEIINLTNEERAAQGLRPVKIDSRLNSAAVEKSAYMFAKNYWAHNAPDGATPWFFIQRAKYRYLYAGENLAKDFQNSQDVVDAWMASKAGHRENILNKNYTDIGVAVTNGVLDGFETTLVVQMFGAESVAPREVAAAPTTPEVVKETEVPLVEGVSKEVQPAPSSTSPSTNTAPGKYSVPSSSPPLIPVVDVVAFGKSVSYTIGFFLLGLFLIDSLVVARKRLVRLSGHSAAHIMVVFLLLATTWLMSPGTIR